MNEALYWRVGVTANGVSYDLSLDLSSFTVEEEDGAPTMLTVQVSDPFAVFSHAFREGMDIEADVGTVDDHRTLFAGRIYHVDGSLPLNGTSSLTLKAYDATMRMGLQQRNRRFRDVALSNIVKIVAQPHLEGRSMTVQVDGDPTFPGEGLRQREETDLAFLRRLAQEAQCAMGIDFGESGEEFIFKAQQQILQATPDVALHYNRCGVSNRLLSFNAQADVANIAVPRVIAGMDPTTGETIDPTATTLTEVGSLDDRLREDNLAAFEEKHPDRGDALRDLISAAETLDETVRQDLGDSRRDAMLAFVTPSQAAQVAQQQPSATLHGMQASGTTSGNKDVHVRKALDIEGAGRFSGTWFVTKATHMLDRQGYRTDFTCQR